MKENNNMAEKNLPFRLSHPIYTHLKNLDLAAIKKLLAEDFDPNFTSSQNHLPPLECMINHLRMVPYSSGKY
jgi:hypothetical protein